MFATPKFVGNYVLKVLRIGGGIGFQTESPSDIDVGDFDMLVTSSW